MILTQFNNFSNSGINVYVHVYITTARKTCVGGSETCNDAYGAPHLGKGKYSIEKLNLVLGAGN